MRKATVIIAAVVILAAAGFAQQAPSSFKVAVVNSQQAFEQSAEGKRVAAQLQERDSKLKNDLQKMDDAIRALETRFNTQRLTLTQEAAVALQSDIDRKQTERKRYEEDQTRDLQQLSVNLIQRLRAEMVAIVEQIAKEKGYDLVLDLAASGVVSWNPTIDVTTDVVRRYDTSKATAAPTKK
jgi:Skp family chaperone for outer membrane proteins